MIKTPTLYDVISDNSVCADLHQTNMGALKLKLSYSCREYAHTVQYTPALFYGWTNSVFLLTHRLLDVYRKVVTSSAAVLPFRRQFHFVGKNQWLLQVFIPPHEEKNFCTVEFLNTRDSKEKITQRLLEGMRGIVLYALKEEVKPESWTFIKRCVIYLWPQVFLGFSFVKKDEEKFVSEYRYWFYSL